MPWYAQIADLKSASPQGVRVRVPPSAPAPGRRATIALLLVATIGGCRGDQATTRPAGTLVRLSADEVKGLDPQAVSDLASLRIAGDQFEGLTRTTADGGVE